MTTRLDYSPRSRKSFALSHRCRRFRLGRSAPFVRPTASHVLLLAALAWVAGCGRPAAEQPNGEKPAGHASADSKAAVAETANAERATSEPGKAESWSAIFMQGVRVGYTHTTRRKLREDGAGAVEFISDTHFRVAREGQLMDQQLRAKSIERPDGELIRFVLEANLGSAPLVEEGRVRGDVLEIEDRQAGRTQRRQVPWSAGVLGFSGTEGALERQPLQPGERRTVRQFAPLLNQIVEDNLAGRDFEKIELLTGSDTLLHVDSVQHLPDGTALTTTLWTDAAGQIVKSRGAAGSQVVVRCTRAEALAEPSGPRLDLILDAVVRPQPPLPANLSEAPQATYRVRIAEDDPAKVFAGGTTQRITPLEAHSAQLTVWAAGPGHLPARDDLPNEPAPGPEFLAPSQLLQLDDPGVRQLADQFAASAAAAPIDKGDPGISPAAQKALALERFVHGIITQKDYSQALASAAETAKTRQGDCTEHAVLLAALARSSGLPSRAAVGMVYLESAGGFAFHMWTEVYVDNHWLPLDATRGRGGTSAAYLKLSDSGLQDDTAFNVFVRVAQVIGQLAIAPLGN